jgi:phospholipase/carboxylesterase
MLVYDERLAEGAPEGLLVLHHGRGTDEHDLLPLAGVLDPGRRLHVVSPRAPLPYLGGWRWYETPQVGHPDPDTFRTSYAALTELHDALWERTGVAPDRTVLGGFSMGTVMSYALGLGGDRPVPAGILAMSGFVPIVPGWEPDLASRDGLRVLISHGRLDPVIDVSFARQARALLEPAGLNVDYGESDAYHNIDPRDLPRVIEWLGATLP